jgi:hypothetical protein
VSYAIDPKMKLGGTRLGPEKASQGIPSGIARSPANAL